MSNWFRKRLKNVKEILSFVIIGGINTATDIAILNALLIGSGNKGRLAYIIFKSISFTIAAINSYFLNKRFTFNYKENSAKTFSKFFVISIISFLINVGTASIIYSSFLHIYEAHNVLLGNISAIAGTLMGLSLNFLGYKFIVFKKNKNDEQI